MRIIAEGNDVFVGGGKTTCLFKLCQEVMHAVGKLKSCGAQPRKGYQRLAGRWAVQVISTGAVH